MNGRDVLLGMSLGAAITYIADPNSGRRRRAVMRDKLVRASRKSRDAADATGRDMANRAAGMVAAARAQFEDEPVDDARLLERVRARLGRVCSHPRAIDVQAALGVVTLRGPILARERNRVVQTVRGVRGVEDVIDALEAHEQDDGVPSLQGEGSVAGPTLDLFQANWAPATQALVAAAVAATGIYAASYSMRRA
jgi:osmotically-inducible protein OsmY